MLVVVFVFFLGGCGSTAFFVSSEVVIPIDKTVLFNGRDLSGWELVSLDKSVEPEDIWSVREGVIYCVGRPRGYLRTTEEYSNYYLHVEWRWPVEPTNSGVFVHAGGPREVHPYWPQCLECQLHEGDAGDFVAMGKIKFEQLEERGKPFRKGSGGIVEKLKKSSEEQSGLWNTCELICIDDFALCFINGVFQNAATDLSFTAGNICLQSEGGPIEFRNVYLEPVQ